MSSNSNNSNKLKLLLFGELRQQSSSEDHDDEVEVAVRSFVRRLRALNASKAGPFHAAFVAGNAPMSLRTMIRQAGAAEAQQQGEEGGTKDCSALPIPVFLHGIDVDDAALLADADGANRTAERRQQQQRGRTPASKEGGDGDDDGGNTAENEKGEEDGEEAEKTISDVVRRLGPNLYLLRDPVTATASRGGLGGDDVDGEGGGIWSIPVAPKYPELVVAAVPRGYRYEDEDGEAADSAHHQKDGAEEGLSSSSSSSLRRSISHVSYRGCDLLLSYELPQGAETVLRKSVAAFPGDVSWDVAQIALLARPRYHVVPSRRGNSVGVGIAGEVGLGDYEQSPPFEHLAATTSTAEVLHVGRLIALSAFNAEKDKKRYKCVHALSIQPLQDQSPAELRQQRPSAQSLLPCPYTDASYSAAAAAAGGVSTVGNDAATKEVTTARVAGLSQASAKRILAEEQRKRSYAADRWQVRQKRPRQDRGSGSNKNQQPQQPDFDPSDSTTLFVHGLHLDTSGQLQSSHQGKVLLLQALKGSTRIRQPPNNASYAFAEFATHEQAAECLESTGGTITVNGVELSVKWGTGGGGSNNPSRKPDGDVVKSQRRTEEQAKDSSTVHFKIARKGDGKDADESAKLAAATAAAEPLRKWMESTLEAALNEGTPEESDDRVTAADEPALRVQVRPMSGYGFLEFASHAAASMALASATGSTDGGRVLTGGCPESLRGVTLYLNWAQKPDKEPHQPQRDVIRDASSGFSFSRPKFGRDARTECWFCLASEACEKHLLTGVYDHCYCAMPKGPCHPGHVLLVPVQHSNRGVLLDADVSDEVDSLKAELRRHADEVYDHDLFVFERAIMTKGGYHTHVQCIPVPRQLGLKLQTTMLRQAAAAKFDIREINSDVASLSVLGANKTGDDDTGVASGYFYAEIPISGKSYRRFLYKEPPVPSCGGRVPLQFGREVLAAVLGKPQLAHWKACVVDEKQEAELATSFRESFSKFNTYSGE